MLYLHCRQIGLLFPKIAVRCQVCWMSNLTDSVAIVNTKENMKSEETMDYIGNVSICTI
jgi:hypothetical protein